MIRVKDLLSIELISSIVKEIGGNLNLKSHSHYQIDIKTINSSKVDLTVYPSLKLKSYLVVNLDFFRSHTNEICIEFSRSKGDYLSFVDLYVFISETISK